MPPWFLPSRPDSRTALVALASGAAAYAIWRYRGRGLLAVIAAGLLVITIAAVVGAQYFVRDAGSLTGRTDIWRFAFRRLWERPLTGFGYAVEGEILQSRLFPLWGDFFDRGSLLELHNDYLSRVIGLGIPALGLWLFLILRPWIWVMRCEDDPWGLKPVALLVVIPLLVRGFAESGMGDCRDPAGILLVMLWAVAERLRLTTVGRQREVAPPRSATPSSSAFAISA